MQYLVVGLGNTPEKYTTTYHNVGFLFLDFVATQKGISPIFNSEKKLKGLVLSVGDNLFLKPDTLMNRSGESVRAVMDFYDISIDHLIVVHDDHDIKLGEFKIQKNRSSAGHNGVSSIIDHVGTRDFTRIRIGIQKIRNPLTGHIKAEQLVLNQISSDDIAVFQTVFQECLTIFYQINK